MPFESASPSSMLSVIRFREDAILSLSCKLNPDTPAAHLCIQLFVTLIGIIEAAASARHTRMDPVIGLLPGNRSLDASGSGFQKYIPAASQIFKSDTAARILRLHPGACFHSDQLNRAGCVLCIQFLVAGYIFQTDAAARIFDGDILCADFIHMNGSARIIQLHMSMKALRQGDDHLVIGKVDPEEMKSAVLIAFDVQFSV